MGWMSIKEAGISMYQVINSRKYVVNDVLSTVLDLFFKWVDATLSKYV